MGGNHPSPTLARMRRGRVVALVVAAALLIATGVGAVLLIDGDAPLLFGSGEVCTASVEGREVSLSPEQAEHAALIAAVGVRRGLPARAVSIALATAYQESKIANLDGGDRDSLGIFQQRPSQGWGTPEQILDPVYATNAFYDALVEVEGYRDLRITEAAQAVQRSAFPEAYEDHATDARVLASALTGNSPGGRFACVVDEPQPDSAVVDGEVGGGALDAAGLTEQAGAVRRDLRMGFGRLALGGFAPGGVQTGHVPGSAHYDGRAIDVFVRPVSADNRRRGWALAAYLVARAARLEIRTVIFDGRIWSAGRSEDGWRDYEPPDRPGDPAILEHRDHVHVDVA